MKHLIVTLLVTFVAASAVAQGTVAFANTSGTKLIDGSTGGPPETADYTIGLYWAAG